MPTSFEYLDLLQEGDAAAIAKAFAGPPIIDDPRSGRVEGREALARFVAETAVWLDERSARGMQIASTRNQQREVQEWVLNLDIGEDGWNPPGAEAIRKIYAMMLADGGIGLEFCTATDDGTACAIEYNAVRWGRAALAPQAGVAVYVRGPSGRLSAARIYDDVQPPEGADSSA